MSSGASGDAMIAARGGDSGVRGKQRSRQFSKAFNFPIPDHLHPNLPSTSLRTPVQASAAISAKKALVIAVQLLYSLRRNYTTLLLHMQRRPSDFTSRRRIWHDAMRRTTGNHTGTTTPIDASILRPAQGGDQTGLASPSAAGVVRRAQK